MKRLLEDHQDPRWFGVIAVIMVLCTSAGLGAIAFASGWIPAGDAPGGQAIVTAASPAPSSTASPAPATATDPAGETPAGLPPERVLELQELERQVARLRGLAQLEPVDRQVIEPSEVEAIVTQALLAGYGPERAEADRILYSLLGLVDDGFDFLAAYRAFYGEQVASFYDPEQDAMVIVGEREFRGPERLTYVHEFVHVLQDQHFPFDQALGYGQEECQRRGQSCAAVQALLEGDATLLEEQWLRTFASDQDRQELDDFFEAYPNPAYQSAPAFVQDLFLFPYLYGREFVLWHYRDGSWAAIDEIYELPPTSTEQIMHPERYPQDQPQVVPLPGSLADDLGPDWLPLDEGSFGEYELVLILGHVLDREQAEQAAAGWGGTSYLLLQRGSEVMLVVVSQWDTIRDAQEAWLALRDYGDNRFGEREARETQDVWSSGALFMLLEHASDQVLWILASEEDSAARARQLLDFPVDLP